MYDTDDTREGSRKKKKKRGPIGWMIDPYPEWKAKSIRKNPFSYSIHQLTAKYLNPRSRAIENSSNFHIEDYTSFIVIRDPLSRLLSAYLDK
ncbi:MAG: sulfotransferase family protein [Colwellia sp.]|nr:sulfotransferase family protein [Colwellia sp.]